VLTKELEGGNMPYKLNLHFRWSAWSNPPPLFTFQYVQAWVVGIVDFLKLI
jgi:hypothetical protein